MAQVTRESITWGRNMERELSHGLIRVLSQVNFKITILMVMEFMNGQMEEFIKEIGKTIKWKDMEPLHGQMEDYMLVSM